MNISANADMREVWKRLGEAGIVLTSCKSGSVFYKSQTSTKGSAMQGCKL